MRFPDMLSPAITRRRTAFGAVGLAAALGAGGIAFAATGSGAPPQVPQAAPVAQVATASPGPASASGKGGARVRSVLARSDHASVELLASGQWVTYTYDRGSVTAVGPSSITLRRPDGQVVTQSITPSTRYRGVASEATVRTGAPALVVSDNGAALRIVQRPAAG